MPVTYLHSPMWPHVVVLMQECLALCAQDATGGPEEVH